MQYVQTAGIPESAASWRTPGAWSDRAAPRTPGGEDCFRQARMEYSCTWRSCRSSTMTTALRQSTSSASGSCQPLDRITGRQPAWTGGHFFNSTGAPLSSFIKFSDIWQPNLLPPNHSPSDLPPQDIDTFLYCHPDILTPLTFCHPDIFFVV